MLECPACTGAADWSAVVVALVHRCGPLTRRTLVARSGGRLGRGNRLAATLHRLVRDGELFVQRVDGELVYTTRQLSLSLSLSS